MLLRVSALALLVSLPAQAQIIQRESKKDAPAPKDGAKPTEDDDILAPAKDPTGKPADEPPPLPKAAKAKKLGLVALVPVGDASKPLADTVTAGLVKELSTSDTFDVTPLAVDAGGPASAGTAKPGTDTAAAEAALKEATDLSGKARALADKRQFGKAKSALELAIQKLEAAAPVLKDSGPLWEAHIALAEIAAKTGNDDEANAAFAKAGVLQPEREIAPGPNAPPAFIRAYQLARKDALAKPKGSVLVDASGAGSKVEIDGKETALSPVHITEVPAGRHMIRAIREGLPSYGVMIDVESEKEVVVSPGFLAADGTSYADVLAQNKWNAAALEQVQKAAQAAGVNGALAGVVQKNGGQVIVQLLYVDASGAGYAKLPSATFQADLLDISIESLKARERAEEIAGAEKVAAGTFTKDAADTVLEGAKAGAAMRTAEVKLRFDVKAVANDAGRSRVLGADEEREVVSAGSSGTRQRLDDEGDIYADKGNDDAPMADPDAGLTEQPWFWPVVIGAGVGAGVLVLGGGAIALAALGVIPDPRPADKGEVHVTIP